MCSAVNDEDEDIDSLCLVEIKDLRRWLLPVENLFSFFFFFLKKFFVIFKCPDESLWTAQYVKLSLT